MTTINMPPGAILKIGDTPFTLVSGTLSYVDDEPIEVTPSVWEKTRRRLLADTSITVDCQVEYFNWKLWQKMLKPKPAANVMAIWDGFWRNQWRRR